MNINKSFLYGALGTIVEWYDFALYGYFATTIAKLFFVKESAIQGVILVFAIFAIGYLMRPIGGAIYGHVGDRYGRKKALIASVSLMSCSTTVIGCLPTYSQIGDAAPILLLLMRMIQGLSAGGETSGAFTYIIETSKTNKGLWGSGIYAVVVSGIVLASFVATMMNAFFTSQQLIFWAWRIGFLSASILGLVVVMLRLHMPETSLFLQLRSNKKIDNFPLLTILKKHFRLIFLLIGLVALPAASFYYIFIFLPTAANFITSFSSKNILLLNSIVMILMILTLPMFGIMSDKIGYQKTLWIAAILLLILSFPLIASLNYWHNFFLFITQFIIAILIACYEAALPAVIVGLAPVPIRYSLISISYNLSFSIFGGLTPLLGVYLLHTYHDISITSFYLIFCILITIISLSCIKKITKKDLH